MKRSFVKIFLVSAASVALAALVVWGGGALAARRMRRAPAEFPRTATLSPEAAAPGDAVRALLEFRLPWGRAVKSARTVPGSNTVLAATAEVGSKWRWGYRVWRVAAVIRPLGTREMTPGKFLVTLDDGERFEAGIPVPRVAEASGKVPDKPRFAAAEKERNEKRSRRLIWAALAAVAAVAAAAIWFLLRSRRRVSPPPPPWEVARSELALLRARLDERDLRPAVAVWKLSDILRNYLAARFALPAATEAGCAFLDRADAVAALTPEERDFLRGFFSAADLVKFARAAADRPALAAALDDAEVLVERTVPPPTSEKSKREAAS